VSRELDPESVLGFLFMRTTYIYELSKNRVPFYIGKSIRPVDRKHGHRTVHGKDTILTIIDEIEGDKSKWKPLETYWIEQYKQWGFILENKNNGGGGVLPILTNTDISNKHKAYYQQHKDKMREQNRASYLKNREQRLAKIKLQDEQNKERKLQYMKTYVRPKKRGSLDT